MCLTPEEFDVPIEKMVEDGFPFCSQKWQKNYNKKMPKRFSDEEYADLLPKKQVGTAVLLFNASGELLIVKPDYRDGWLVPGGVTEDNESPLHCAIRETKEEIGLDIPDLQLVGIYYGTQNGVFTDSLKFIFSGGVVPQNQLAQISLQMDELEEYAFALPEKAMPLFSSNLEQCIPACLEAIKTNTVAYIESPCGKCTVRSNHDTRGSEDMKILGLIITMIF
jgi:8-oxo-dGTP pyrophosphatase MutT (NUDIX family)